MSNKLLFWNKYNTWDKRVYLFMLSLFVLSIFGFIYAYFWGIETAIDWETTTTIEGLPLTIDYFNRGLLNFRVETDNLFIKEMFHASGINIKLWASYLYFVFLISSYIVGVSVITCLSRTWYFVGMLVFIFTLSQLNLELLELFGQRNKYPVFVVIALYAGLSFYFYSFKQNVSLIYRLISFFALTAIITSIVYFQKKEVNPVLLINNHGILIPIAFTILFFIVVSFDALLLFLNLTASSKSNMDKRRLLNFSVLSGLYMLNLTFFILKKLGILEWNLLYINMYILICFSGIVGIWGYKKRAELNDSYMPFFPLGSLMYLCYGTIAFGTMAYIHISFNQPLIDALEYFILISQFAFGTFFLIYVLVNFGFLFGKSISIYQIVFVPRRIPFFTVYTAGGILALALIFKMNMYPYFLTMSGYMNSLGDYYKSINDNILAKEYYFNGIAYARYNQRSNFSYATILEQEGKKAQVQEYYGAMLGNKTIPQGFVNLANWYLEQEMKLQAIFTLSDGIQKYPLNPQISNNLGLMFSQTGVSDSTYIYLYNALQNSPYSSVACNNLIFKLAADGAYVEADSISNQYHYKDFKFNTNTLGISNYLNKPVEVNNLLIANADSISPFEYTYLYNKQLNAILARKFDSKQNQFIQKLTESNGNADYATGLLFNQALQFYYQGNKIKGIESLENLYLSSSNYKYAKILAIWYFEQEAYELAYSYFSKTIENEGQDAVLNSSIALCEMGKFSEAKSNLEQLKFSKSKTIADISKQLLEIHKTKESDVIKKWSDALKYQFIHFRAKEFSLPELEKITSDIDTIFYQNISKAELIKIALQTNQISYASNIWQSIKNQPAENTFEKGFLNEVYFKLMLVEKKWDRLKAELPSTFLNSDKENLKIYWQACLMENDGDVKAKNQYHLALAAAPFDEDVIINASRYFSKINDSTTAYEILAKSVRQNNPSVKVLKCYIEMALALDFDNYAEDALKRLSLLISKKDFDVYKKGLQK